MKLIIAGSRLLYPSASFISGALALHGIPTPLEIVSGAAQGVDSCGEILAKALNVPKKLFPADWSKHGRAAGPIRNQEMAKYADAALIIWDGKSKGSGNMRDEMRKLGKPVYQIIVRSND